MKNKCVGKVNMLVEGLESIVKAQEEFSLPVFDEFPYSHAQSYLADLYRAAKTLGLDKDLSILLSLAEERNDSLPVEMVIFKNRFVNRAIDAIIECECADIREALAEEYGDGSYAPKSP